MNREKVLVQGFDVSGKTVAVVGCGGLGVNVCVHLAGAGVARLLLWDHDVVETRNLNRQFLFTPADAGASKAKTLARRLREYAPDCEIAYFDKKIVSPEDLLPAKGCDAVAACADNVEARRAAWAFCETRGIAFATGAVAGDTGTAFLAVPGLTPDPDDAGVFASPGVAFPSPGATVGLIGALEAKLILDHLKDDRSSRGVLWAVTGCEVAALPIRRAQKKE